MTTRIHSEEQKAEALRLYQSEGLAAAWRATGIPKPSIVRWAQEAGLERSGTEQTRAATEVHVVETAALRIRLRGMLLEKAVDLLERMDAPHVEFKGKDADQVTYPIAPAGAVQNYATSAAILIDKYRLEVGEPTTREDHHLFDGFSDHETRALADAAREYLAERAAREGEGVASESSVEGAGKAEPATA